jgi:uncharacterized repeat protein (TIGR01451 family)
MFLRNSVAVMVTAAVAVPAIASAGPFQVTSKILTEQKSKAADGTVRVSLVPANKVVPGNKVVFVLAYHNTGKQPIGNIVLDNPVPAGIAYRGPAANSAAPEVSVDGKTYGPLASLQVRTAAGMRAAGPDDVTNVRWRLAGTVAAGAQGQVSFQGILK